METSWSKSRCLNNCTIQSKNSHDFCNDLHILYCITKPFFKKKLLGYCYYSQDCTNYGYLVIGFLLFQYQICFEDKIKQFGFQTACRCQPKISDLKNLLPKWKETRKVYRSWEISGSDRLWFVGKSTAKT